MDKETRSAIHELIDTAKVAWENWTPEQSAWEKSEPKENPLLTRRLVEYFYDNLDKFIWASTILGMGVIGYGTLSAIRGLDNSSFPLLAANGAIFVSSLIGGAGVGFIGGLVGGMGIALLSDKVENLERNIKKRFSKNILFRS